MEGFLIATVTQEALFRPLTASPGPRSLPSRPPGRAPGAPSELQQALKLEQIAACDVFTGTEDAIGPTHWGRVYGGHVLAQSLVAAQQTVPKDFHVHSLHGYFILAGKTGVKLLFEVDRVRDGKSYVTRVVRALQDGKAIFHMNLSFTRREWGPSFQTPGKELHARLQSRGLTGRRLLTPEELLARGVRPVVACGADNKGATESLNMAAGDWWSMNWVRHKAPLPDDLHESILAWISDSLMVTTSAKPHLAKGVTFTMQMSLDHAIHFHRPFRADEWLLFDTRSSVSAHGRGLAIHEIYDRDHCHVATVQQEALIRPRRDSKL